MAGIGGQLSASIIDFALITMLALALLSGRVGTTRAFAGFIIGIIITGRVSFNDAVTAITSPAIIAVTSLVIVAVALTKIPGIGQALFGRARLGMHASLIRFLGLTGLVSAFTPNTAVVGAFMGPASRHPSLPAHALLLPLSYMALAGGMLTPFGTSASLMVVGEAARHGLNINVLDFALPGAMVALAVFAALVLAAPMILKRPEGASDADKAVYYVEARVNPGSRLIGRNVGENQLRHLQGFFLAEIVRQERIISPVSPSQSIEEGDRLIFVGDFAHVGELHAINGLSIDGSSQPNALGAMFHAVIAHNSILVGRTLKEADFRARFDASVLAVRRGEESLSGKLGEIRLKTGDSLILAAGPDFRSRENLRTNLHILDVEDPGQVPLNGRNSALLCGAFAIFIIVAILQLIPFALAAFLMAALCILSGWISPRETKRIFPFELVIILWGAVLLSQVIQQSGASAVLADFIAHQVGGLPHWAALAAIFMLAWFMTELFSNASAALITLPVALGTALQLSLPAEAFVLATAFGASASFLLPFGYQTHLMVLTPGEYRLSHFLRLGSVVLIAYAIAAIATLSILHF
ncbi:SLC13 family permease [Maricaulis salignorans]|uniref:SLC13 family permease n=1 Tax=Maricaulis salignorans TaxID=144026 RepID=UPI003A94901C